MESTEVLKRPWVVEKVPVSDWAQSLYKVQVSVPPAPKPGALQVAVTDSK